MVLLFCLLLWWQNRYRRILDVLAQIKRTPGAPPSPFPFKIKRASQSKTTSVTYPPKNDHYRDSATYCSLIAHPNFSKFFIPWNVVYIFFVKTRFIKVWWIFSNRDVSFERAEEILRRDFRVRFYPPFPLPQILVPLDGLPYFRLLKTIICTGE